MTRISAAVRRRLSRAGADDEQALNLHHLRRLLGRRPRCILEIGANDGSDSLRLRTVFPKAALHCFEPDPRAFRSLTLKVQGRRIQPHQLAIGAIDGETDFHQSSGMPPDTERSLPDGWDLSGSIRRPLEHLDAHPWCTFDSIIKVPVARLDTWANQHGVEHVDFIWADVQGAEIDLIEGGSTTLANTRYLYTEYSNRELYSGQVNLEGLLAALPAWTVERLYPNDVLLRNTAYPR